VGHGRRDGGGEGDGEVWAGFRSLGVVLLALFLSELLHFLGSIKIIFRTHHRPARFSLQLLPRYELDVAKKGLRIPSSNILHLEHKFQLVSFGNRLDDFRHE
jgi:hypothetical protein